MAMKISQVQIYMNDFHSGMVLGGLATLEVYFKSFGLFWILYMVLIAPNVVKMDLHVGQPHLR